MLGGMSKRTDVWIRTAGNARRIRTEGDPYHWRCYVGREAPEIPLRGFRIEGPATPANVLHGTDPAAANPLGLTAWIDYYGDVEVVDDIACITLKKP